MTRIAHQVAQQRGRLGAALLVLLVLVASCTTDQRVDWKFYRANRLVQKGDLERAANLYYEAFEENPSGPRAAEAIFAYAYTLEVHLRDPILAAEVYRRIVRLFPDSQQAMEGLERAANIEVDKIGHPERALLDYTRLLELFPSAPRRFHWSLAIAECYLQMGQALQAETEIVNFLKKIGELPKEQFPEDLYLRARGLLGKVLLMQDRPGEAATIFEELSTHLAKDSSRRKEWLEARYNLGQALIEVDETDRALDVFREIEGEFPRQEVIQEKINFLTIRKDKRNR